MPEESGPFRLDLASLKEGPNQRRLEGGADQIGLPEENGLFVGPILLEACFIRSHANVEVQGRLRARLRQSCVRCLAEVETLLEPEVRLYCKKRRGREGAAAAMESPEEGLMYYDGRSLDLDGEVRETLLLEMPGHPLCRPHCMGLCPRCGEDRNLGDCACLSGGSGGKRDAPDSTRGEERGAQTREPKGRERPVDRGRGK